MSEESTGAPAADAPRPAARTLPTRMDPAVIEPRWQKFWEQEGFFRAPPPNGVQEHWTIVLPPPNLTGVLNLGHSLGGTVQDVLSRWQRMKGVPTLWLPGVDHAGLATQMAVRKDLEKRGIPAATLSREELLGHIRSWRTEKERYIRRQLTAHGFSLDWSRYVYTMDPSYGRAVQTAFLRLYEQKLVYRAERMVPWDPKALTALSDLEVIPTETHGTLWYVRYPDPATPKEGGIVVATTRPETMFGDVAVAVHPDDDRHRGLVGTRVHLPLTDRDIPVVTDTAIDPAFGNGALKVTPSHDPVDRDIALRHPELPPRRDTLDERAHLTGEFVPPALRGMDRSKAREHVVAMLREEGLLVKEEPHVHNVGVSERSDVPIEPRLSTQWFVDMTGMGGRALSAVRQGDVKIHPEHWTKTYYHFMEHLQPWCISRQVVWGHPIPVWYCGSCKAEKAYAETPTRCASCGASDLRQDPDVLDTWFSSWLWPFATLGWPEPTPDLASYFPVSVLVTGSDIVFFWVARMIMGSLHFLDRPPFPETFLTGILVDRTGRKLSKHLGNSPDPIEVIEKWGADAFRFGVLFPLPVDQGGFWDHQNAVESARNFLTKLWNLSRLVLSSLPEGTPAPREPPRPGPTMPWIDRWLLSRWSATITEVEGALRTYDLTGAVSMVHGFVWHEMADWWAEAAKDRLSGRDGPGAREESARVGLFVLERTLRLLHPIAPHMTEELWHALPHAGPALTVARWPFPAEVPRDPEAEEMIALVQELVRGLRVLRAEAHVPPSDQPGAQVRATSEGASRSLGLGEVQRLIATLARVQGPELLAPNAPPAEDARPLVLPGAEIFLRLPKGRAGEAGERAALEKERATVAGLLAKTDARLADPTFVAKAPEKVVAEAREKRKELAERLALLESHLGRAPGAG